MIVFNPSPRMITRKWLEKMTACGKALAAWDKSGLKEIEAVELVQKLIAIDKLEWANWLIVRIMTYKQYVDYMVFPVERVLDIHEKECFGNNTAKRAITAAKKCIKRASQKNKRAAAISAVAASSEAAVTTNKDVAAYICAASIAAYVAAYSYYDSAVGYDAITVNTAYGAKKELKLKILRHGLKLLQAKPSPVV